MTSEYRVGFGANLFCAYRFRCTEQMLVTYLEHFKVIVPLSSFPLLTALSVNVSLAVQFLAEVLNVSLADIRPAILNY